MSLRKMSGRTLLFSVVLLCFLPLLPAEAQDVDVPGNLTMRNSTATQGNILKAGVTFLHNFGIANTFLGSNAGNLTMSGGFNTASGTGALRFNTTGNSNTAIGNGALVNNSSGFVNTAIGAGALASNTSADRNTACGALALASNTTGILNTATGGEALRSNTIGNFNTASGFAALVSNTTGSQNTANGREALVFSTTGDSNTATGYQALFSNTTGSNNTALGAFANVAPGLDNLTNATAIGAGAVVNASNKIRLGNETVTVIEGLVGFTANSDRNRQETFQPVRREEVLSKIRRLSLTSWNFIGQDPGR